MIEHCHHPAQRKRSRREVLFSCKQHVHWGLLTVGAGWPAARRGSWGAVCRVAGVGVGQRQAWPWGAGPLGRDAGMNSKGAERRITKREKKSRDRERAEPRVPRSRALHILVTFFTVPENHQHLSIYAAC